MTQLPRKSAIEQIYNRYLYLEGGAGFNSKLFGLRPHVGAWRRRTRQEQRAALA